MLIEKKENLENTNSLSGSSELTDNQNYPPLSLAELLEVLATTIKYDDDNKLVAFLAMLSAYTEDSQLNLSFNAPSSSGKSFIPTEIASLFPSEDVIELGYASPTSFIHARSDFRKAY